MYFQCLTINEKDTKETADVVVTCLEERYEIKFWN